MKHIRSIEIINSIFFEDLKIEFDEKLNCIMGGRGTGKSTILYFLKSAFSPNLQKGKTNDILRSNLGLGTITIEMEANDGSIYKIIKTYNEEPQPFKHPNGDFIALQRIYNEIECDFYETNSIEEIGRSPLDRLELVDKKVKSEINDFKELIYKLQIDLDANAQDIKTHNSKINFLHQSLSQYTDILNELQEFQANAPTDIKDDEKMAFESADANEKIRADEKRFFIKTSNLYSDLLNQLKLSKSDLIEIYSNSTIDNKKFLNRDILDKVLEYTNRNNEIITLKFQDIEAIITLLHNSLNEDYNELLDKHESQQSEFIQLKQKFESNRDYYSKYNILTNRVKDKEIIERDIQELEVKKRRLLGERKLMLDKFNELKNNVFSKRLKAVKEINLLLQGDVKVTLEFSGITTEFENKLREALRGSGLKYNDLIFKIIETFKSDQFSKAIQERNIEQLCQISGIDKFRSEQLINALFDTEYIYQIESLYCEDLPEFKLKIDSGDILIDNYRNSDQLSMGQRCTTVLPIIFAVSTNPLIIDQPEDNLDNKYISEKIHEIIKNQKDNRQLIFITHNPNIPVLSDSEYNLFLNYENKKSSKEVEGNIDDVKDQIVKILEGGENAFRTRKDKYEIL